MEWEPTMLRIIPERLHDLVARAPIIFTIGGQPECLSFALRRWAWAWAQVLALIQNTAAPLLRISALATVRIFCAMRTPPLIALLSTMP